MATRPLGRMTHSHRVPMKRDLYSGVSDRIVAELEAGAAPRIKPWSATPGANTPCNAVTNRPYSGCNVVLLWMAQAAGYRTPRYLTFKQALELGGHVRKGERGTKVYLVKQLEIQEGTDDKSSTRLVPMMREYTMFNVDQCEHLPDSVKTGKPLRVRNPDARDDLADEFLRSTGADIREGHGEAFTCRAAISFRCLPSRRSRARISFMAWFSTNFATGQHISLALIGI
jgi:antirestriction protein ArdC